MLGALAAALAAAAPAAAQPANASLAWLRAQLTPNAAVPVPDPPRRGLILSYAPGAGAPGLLHRRSFTYDAALGAIAFTTAGDWGSASRLLQALARVQRPDGTFWFSYRTDVAWPTELDHDMGIVRSGATAWAGYAFAFYLERRPPADPRLERERGLFLGIARRVADALLGDRVAEPGPARGLVRGGRALIRLVPDPQGPGIREVYEDRPVGWVSTEHNLATHFLLTALHRLTGEAQYGVAARGIQEGLQAGLWQEDLGQFAQGVLADGQLDRQLALDCASWGALFLWAIGDRDRAIRAATVADRVYRSADAGATGHRPYDGAPLYEDPDVQRRLLPAAPEARWQDLPFVWTEGSLGVALALARLGRGERAREIVREVLKLRHGGGIRLASRELPHQFAAWPSVAGTAWHVIVDVALRSPATPGLWTR